MDARHLRNLWLFSLLAREMSFTKAAEVAGMSQPLFSRHIQALETRLGKTVVKRLPRRIELTPTGQALAPLAKRLTMTLENYEAEVEKTASGEYDQVNLGSVNWAMHLILPKICGRIRNQLPHLSLKVREISSSYAVEMLKRGDLDFAFCYVFLDRDPELDYLHVADTEFAVVTREDHPLASRPGPLPWEALQGEPLVATPRWAAPNVADTFIARALAHGVNLVATEENKQLLTQISLVNCGMGSAIVPLSLAPMLPAGTVALRMEDPVVIPFMALARKKNNGPAVETLRASPEIFQAPTPAA